MPILEDDLRNAIADRKAVLVVGAGISIQATGNAPCASWTGLLHDGAARCAELDPSLQPGWLDAKHRAIDSGRLSSMLGAASEITIELHGPKGGEYARWLLESVGALALKNDSVLAAIAALGAPIATTNYDNLLEESTGLPPVTWREGARVERVLHGDERAVLHLHGHFRDPESVVLGIQSYDSVLGDEHAQNILRALTTMKTLIFVGCGAGLEDPNFGELLRWTGRVFRGSGYRRFRLALESERAALQAQHPPEQRLFVIPYGKRHDELAAFVRSLLPAAVVPAAPAGRPADLPGKRPCFGRDAEIESMAAALLAPNPTPLPVIGHAGIGKTTLAIAVLHDKRIVARYRERRYFVRCDAALSASAAAAEIGRALGLPASPQVLERALRELERGPALLVLDNAETPLYADPLATEELLAQVASVDGVALVATVRGNQRPGGPTWLEAIRPEPLKPDAARKAFLAIAGQFFAGDPHLDRLLEAVDRIPLPVTLLARLAEGSGSSLEPLWERWQDERTSMLRHAGGRDRLTNVELSYEISLKSPRMTAKARRALSVLAGLPAGVAVNDLKAVLPALYSEVPLLERLSLCSEERHRAHLLAPLRDFMNRRYAPEAPDAAQADDFYLRLSMEGEKVGAEGGAAAAGRLYPEAANIEAAISHALLRADPRPAVDAAMAFGEFARFAGVAAQSVLDRAQERAAAVEDWWRVARTLERLGDLLVHRSEHTEAAARYEAALPLFERVHSVQGQANCIWRLGDIDVELQDYDRAARRYDQALPLFRQVNDVLGEANCTKSQGDLALARSDNASAQNYYEAALPLYRRLGVVLGQANCIRRLGHIAFAMADYEGARRRFEAALPLYRGAGAAVGEANCIAGLGDIAFARAELGSARAHFEEALELYGRVAEPFSLGETHRKLARAAVGPAERRRHVDAARENWRRIKRDDLIRELDSEFGDGSSAAAL